jgi:murein DD-endopeptidase MepM/ murein hydrolase activator NlpD
VTSYPQDYSTGPPPVTMALSYPIPGAPIVSRFGMRIDPVLNTSLMHEGIDIWAGEGTPIRAAGAGTVIWAGDRHGYGNAVFIDHGRGVVTISAHQSKVGVAVGQHVGAGDTIGYVGHTGLAAGPHLHFEVRVNGVAYDPLYFVSPR